MATIDDDIRTTLSKLRLVHELQTSNLIDQALVLLKLEASLLVKETQTDDSNWNRSREKRSRCGNAICDRRNPTPSDA